CMSNGIISSCLNSYTITCVKLLYTSIFSLSTIISTKSTSLSGTSLPSLLLLLSSDTFSELLSDSSFSSFVATLLLLSLLLSVDCSTYAFCLLLSVEFATLLLFSPLEHAVKLCKNNTLNKTINNFIIYFYFSYNIYYL